MSIHRSLVLRDKLKRHRNVLKRSERLQRLEEEEKLKEGASVFGLPKSRNILFKAKPKVKKAAEGEAAEGTTAAATDAAAAPGAKPAADAKPAAKDKAVKK